MGKETKTFGITRAHLEEDAGDTLALSTIQLFEGILFHLHVVHPTDT